MPLKKQPIIFNSLVINTIDSIVGFDIGTSSSYIFSFFSLVTQRMHWPILTDYWFQFKFTNLKLHFLTYFCCVNLYSTSRKKKRIKLKIRDCRNVREQTNRRIARKYDIKWSDEDSIFHFFFRLIWVMCRTKRLREKKYIYCIKIA